MNIHLPAILGFTRYQGFDPSPYNLVGGIATPLKSFCGCLPEGKYDHFPTVGNLDIGGSPIAGWFISWKMPNKNR
jgi:hypothetical protein